MEKALLFFGYGPLEPRAVWGPRRICRLARRRPRKALVMGLTRLTTLASRSQISTSMIGDGTRVLVPKLRKHQIVTHQELVDGYSRGRLAAVCCVECPRRPALWAYIGSPKQPAARVALCSVVRWATRGRVASEDCTETVVSCLRMSGLDVPRRITTPISLLRWAAIEAKGDLRWLD